jgi:ribonuclease VapC
MILDTSALVAILYREPEAAQYTQIIHDTERCAISDMFLRRAGIAVEPFTVAQAQLARQAFHDFGKGRHPAGLNFGDCFAYALAKSTGEPLLFKGNDFRQTDIAPALI